MVTQKSQRFLYLLVFTSGMTTLAVELTASRLLGSVFGTSNIVWANVIGLMLLYLTVGYFLGGWLADRSPRHRILYRIVIWAAFLSALIPLIARPVLQLAARSVAGIDAALAFGSFAAILILFSIPVTLLGTVSPFAIRLAVTSAENAGRVSGRIYAISTIGSILGTFLPVLLFIPELGTTVTFLVFAAILYLVAFIGLWQHGRSMAVKSLWMPVAIILFALLVIHGPLRPALTGQILLYETETPYNYIQVQEDTNGNRYLYLNEGQGIHSQWHPEQIVYERTWDFFLAGPYFNSNFTPSDMDAVLVVGLAAGTIARQHIAIYGDIPIDGIEIDPGIVEAGARFFDMNTTEMPSLNVIVEDGRYALRELANKRYTTIALDAYKPPYIPWHLTTIEFFQEIDALLQDDGVVVVNVGRTFTDRRLVEALTNTMGQVFPTIHTLDVPGAFNTILIATRKPTSISHLADNITILPLDYPLLQSSLELALSSHVPTQRSEVLFTDDRAPVETLIDSLVINFILGGELESLRQ